jgi:hypothetical protein
MQLPGDATPDPPGEGLRTPGQEHVSMTKYARILSVLGVLLALAVLGASSAVAQTVEVTASWTPPSEGSPVHHYVLQLSTNGGPYATVGSTTTTTYVMELEVGQTYRARVAGVDAEGRMGPYSEESDPYTPDLGPPGQPGKPMLM